MTNHGYGWANRTEEYGYGPRDDLGRAASHVIVALIRPVLGGVGSMEVCRSTARYLGDRASAVRSS